MDEFRIALIGIGVFAIVGILAHGMWTIRKNNKSKQENSSGRDAADEVHEPKITISNDDPLLMDPVVAEASSETSYTSHEPSSHTSTPEYDPLVGEDPLYDSSDIRSPVKTPQTSSEQNSGRSEDLHNDDFDEDGIGAVRVLSDAPAAAPKVSSAADDSSESEVGQTDDDLPEPPGYLLRKDGPEEAPTARKMSVDDIPMIDTSMDIDDAPRRSGALKSEHTRTEVVGGNRMGKKSQSIAEKAMKFVGRGASEDTKSTKPTSKKTVAPKVDANKDQIRLDLEAAPEVETSPDTPEMDDVADNVPQQEVLILNVRVPEGKVIQGASLLPSLLTLGFKFGEHNMFHRHAASNGKGPRLFTLANMFNPGTFDIDNMENFNTTGVSLFMTLPIEADAHQVFNMMHNAARKLADEFGAQVLDGRRSVLTRQSLQQYVEKIREFERRRMIRRS